VTVRVGFLGGGFIATYHGKMLHGSGADVEIAAVHDPDRARAQAFAAASGATAVGSTDEVLTISDAVYVCTPTATHPSLVAQVAAAGRAVFCEKPLGVDLTAARAVARAVDDAGVVNQVGLVLRDSPALLALRAMLADTGAFGRVMALQFRDDQYLPVQGIYGSTWRSDPAMAGAGCLLEHSVHDADLLRWLLGDVTSVSARTRDVHGIVGIEDVAVMTTNHADGAIATLTSVWHDVLERPSQRRIEVICERGWMALEGDVLGPVRWQRDDDEGSLEGEALIGWLEGQGIEIRNPDGAFVECVAAGSAATPDCASALPAHAVVEAAYRSAASAGEWTTPEGS
jgi:predicted dehydrogenase